MTEGRFSARHVVEPVAVVGSSEQTRKRKKDDDQEDSDSSVDVYTLYSNYSSSSDSENSLHCDPDYKPNINRKRLLLEYENARTYENI